MIDLELWEKRKKELKLTFDELSSLSGIPKRTILGVFRKEVITPRIDTVQAIEKALGLYADPPQAKTTDTSDAEKRLLQAFRRLVPSMQDYVLEMVEKLIVSQPAAADAAKRA